MSDGTEEAIWRILQVEALAYLPGRVEALAQKHGFRISGVKIRRMKTRWGSCSAKNGINLNSWLVMLPDHLSDYVILHELVHTGYKDHSAGFWESLDMLTGGHSKRLRKELRRQQIMSVDAE
jgi:predicted metal-dependent hydrolase